MPKPTATKSTGKKEPAISKTSPPKPVDNQLNTFEKAMKLFHKRDFAAALPLFEETLKGGDVAMSHAAQMHIRMCQQRMEKSAPKLTTVEDFYAYGLTLIGRRELDLAEQQALLQRARCPLVAALFAAAAPDAAASRTRTTQAARPVQRSTPRSKERRVGKECRSRWSPYH